MIADARLSTLDRLAARELAEFGVPGMALALVDADRPPTVRTVGFADLAAARAVEPDTLFEIGSIGKAFTAIVVLQLVEAGRLRLDAPVAEALHWFEMPVVGRPITIHDLLTHTAGITAGIDGSPEAAAQVWALRDRRPGSPPGPRFHYSNLGYKILGLVIEAVEGRRYPDVVRSRILDPLGMTATEPEITHDTRPRLAVGYDYLYDDRLGYPGRPLAPATWLETATADGSLASTAGDMAEFARMLLRRGAGPAGRLLDETSFGLLVGPHARPAPGAGYGYGLASRELADRTLIGHPGGMVGYVAAVQVDPVAGVGCVVLQNGLMGRPVTLARAILAAIDVAPGEAPALAPATVADPEPELDLAGTYLREVADGGDGGFDRFEVVVADGGPALRWHDGPTSLDDLGDGRFLAMHPDLDHFALRFEPAVGRPDVAWHGGVRFVRDGATPPPLPAPSGEIAACAGHFRSFTPWTTNFRVIVRGDALWLLFSAAPDGFDDEQPLAPLPDGSFRVGDDRAGPEDVRFDAVVEGRPLRAWLSGVPYYRVA